ncbi:LOW QUALITY PROTEIN: acyl-coenzyme A thioesterase 1-like [Pungitius pungitius]|uniref:LOW QUALITY PROTEIN: acyl-coenzyme A thioesterase 1-like n=1 Tax=Pungitius pungitius TaxID=134920 RepID=UPI002E0FA544
MSSQVRLSLLPRARCMFDEPVQVKVAGLRSRQVVTLRARSTDEKGVVFSSSATVRADGSGRIDLERDPSLGGTYTGVEPMGLLWSMRPDALHKRFQRTKSLNPHVVKFSVHEEEGGMLAEATNERLLIGDGVIRRPIKEGNIRGVVFTPPGEGPFPAVLDLYTFGGGLSGKKVLNDPRAEENEATLIPVERAEGRLLFAASEDDLNWDSKAYVDMMVERLQRHGKDNFESVCYPGAGHYLEPPYGPYCPSSLHGVAGRVVLWGGEARSHAAAEVHLWKKIQEFFRTHLSCDTTQTKAKL